MTNLLRCLPEYPLFLCTIFLVTPGSKSSRQVLYFRVWLAQVRHHTMTTSLWHLLKHSKLAQSARMCLISACAPGTECETTCSTNQYQACTADLDKLFLVWLFHLTIAVQPKSALFIIRLKAVLDMQVKFTWAHTQCGFFSMPRQIQRS